MSWGWSSDLSRQFGTERQSLFEEVIFGILSIDANAQRDQKWLATARFRAGYLVTPDILFFASAGLATAQTDISKLVTETVFGTFTGTLLEGQRSEIRTGVAFSAGVEIKTTAASSVKFEVLHYDLGGSSLNIYDPQSPDPVAMLSFENKGDIFRFGVNISLNAD